MKSKNSQTNKIKEDLTATLCALLFDESVQIEFDENCPNNFFIWNQNLISGEKKITVPQVEVAEILFEESIMKRFRAASDMAACYLLFHDKEIHAQKDFAEEEQKLFDEFEKIRVVAEVKNSYLGVVQNILQKIEDDVFSLDAGLSLILLGEIFPQEVLEKTQNQIWIFEKKISKEILQKIKNLSQKTSDQLAFAQGVVKVLEMLRQEKETQNQKQNEAKSESKNEKPEDDLNNFGQENIEAKDEENFSKIEEEQGISAPKIAEEITDIKAGEKQGESLVRSEESASKSDKIEFKNAYKIFTSKFDEVIFPQKLISKNELEILRDQLELKLTKLNSISKKMTLKLKKKLLAKKNSFLEYDASRGILDRKKLSRLVIDPLFSDIWINNKTHEYQDTALTILLDNSGSMRGNPIVMSAMACEIIATILEKFSVKTEIIGFTTADWKGGRAKKLWESSGRAPNPGRLNELRHIIYKHFNQSFKKAKTNLGLMLKEGVLKENIDGEALLFARSRLMRRDEKRKILMIISDGTPIDDSTASANDSDILSDHLNHVINKIEQSSKIEIVGIGIGHSTDDFYRNSITIKSLEELGDAMIGKIADLI
jgi:cobaltochelatase CobT